jgi:tagatose 6-phosphate kinase
MILCLGATPTVQRTMRFARLQLDQVNRAASVSQYASGKSINAARVVHALGMPVLATGFLGGDSGKFIRDDLNQAGISHEFVEVSPATRLCITLLDDATATATELIEESAPLLPDAFDPLLRLTENHLPGATALVLSGSLPSGAPTDFYAQCVRLATAANVPVVLDARGQPLLEALPHRPFIIKPNREELAATTGIAINADADLRAAIGRVVAMGARWIAVTLGGEGAVLSDGKAFWRFQAPRVKAISAVGSGDSFAAGLAVGLSRGQSPKDAIPLAIACGTANALTPQAGHLALSDVQRLLPQVSAHPF